MKKTRDEINADRRFKRGLDKAIWQSILAKPAPKHCECCGNPVMSEAPDAPPYCAECWMGNCPVNREDCINPKEEESR